MTPHGYNTLLEDTVHRFSTEWLVRVKEGPQYVSCGGEKARGINAHGNPTGVSRGFGSTAGWTLVECRFAEIRPNYPVRHLSDRFMEGEAETHHKTVESLEEKERGIIFSKKVDREPERDAQEMADDVIELLEESYESAPEIQTLD